MTQQSEIIERQTVELIRLRAELDKAQRAMREVDGVLAYRAEAIARLTQERERLAVQVRELTEDARAIDADDCVSFQCGEEQAGLDERGCWMLGPDGTRHGAMARYVLQLAAKERDAIIDAYADNDQALNLAVRRAESQRVWQCWQALAMFAAYRSTSRHFELESRVKELEQYAPIHPPPTKAREAARRRHTLQGAEAQALEHALTITERERDEARAQASRWREALEWALGLEADPTNHTPEWAAELVREIREIGNQPKNADTIPARHVRELAEELETDASEHVKDAGKSPPDSHTSGVAYGMHVQCTLTARALRALLPEPKPAATAVRWKQVVNPNASDIGEGAQELHTKAVSPARGFCGRVTREAVGLPAGPRCERECTNCDQPDRVYTEAEALEVMRANPCARFSFGAGVYRFDEAEGALYWSGQDAWVPTWGPKFGTVDNTCKRLPDAATPDEPPAEGGENG